MSALDLTDDDFAGLPNPRGIAAANINAKPDQAATAIDLAKTTGVPADVIYPDVEGFQERTRARAAGDIVVGNPKLRDYAAGHPLKAKVSADDWANLDAYSEAQTAFPKEGLLEAIGRGYSQGFNSKEWVEGYNALEQKFPLWHGTLNPLIMMGDTANRSIQGAFGAVTTALQHYLGEKVGAEFAEVLQFVPLGEIGALHHLSPEMKQLNEGAIRAQKLVPYLEAGKTIPRGVDPEVDQWRKEEGIEDLARLKEAFKAAQGVQTRERAPEFFKDFAAQHTGEDSIGISAEIAAKLYGEKIPEEGDNLLGFVPDMAHQLEVAKETGADVRVPIADVMAHMNPEVFKQVEEGIRTRPEGFTKGEELPQEAKIPMESGPNYPDPQIGQVHLGYYAARDADMLKDTGAKGPHEVPEWLKPAQDIVDQLAKDFGMKVTPKIWAAKNKDPGEIGYADQDGHIVLRDDLTPEQTVATVLHELGHQVQNQKFYELEPGQKQEIVRAWEGDKQRGLNQTVGQLRPLTTEGSSTAEVPINRLTPKSSKYVLSFEEWFAEQTQRWLTKTEEPKTFVDKFFKGIADIWRKIYEKISGHQEVAPAMDQFLRGIWQGAELRGGGIKPPVDGGPQGPMQIPPKRTGLRVFESPDAIGMSKDHWRRYEKLIEKQHEEDYQRNLAKAMKEEKKRQTVEWAQKRNETMGKVINDFAEIPRFIADRSLREGEVPKIGANYLSDEQKAGLPKSYWGKDGVHPDRLASYFGYESGNVMVDDLSALHLNRGKTPPAKYVTDLVNKETDRRMEAAHGDLAQNILDAAKEQTLRPGVLDTMHAEIEAMAADHGHALPYTKESLLDHVKQKLNDMKLSLIDSDRFMGNERKISKSIEDALLKDDPQAGFKQRQVKYINAVYAKEALAIEKVKATFDWTVDRFKDRVVTGVRQEYTDQIHMLMKRLGLDVLRPVEDITENMRKAGFADFREFAQKMADGNSPLDVPEFLFDPTWNKTMKDITGGEFKEVADLIKQMVKHGRDSLTVVREGVKYEVSDLLAQAQAQLKALSDKPNEYTGHDTKAESTIAHYTKSFFWSAINIEAICKRLDNGDPNGFFTQHIALPAIRAANYKDRLVKETAKELNKIGDFADLHRVVDNDIFVRPDGEPGFMKMTRNNVIAVLGHMGNADNFARLTEGYKVDPEVVKAWVHKHTTKEDWEKMQKIGHIFDKLFKMADDMSYNLNEIGIQKIKLGAVDNPHGAELTGWYNPVAYDTKAVRSPKIGEPAMPTEITVAGEQAGFTRYYATTRQNYTKGRTDYRGSVLLDTVSIPVRMQQMIHDITMRPAIVDLNKFVNDKQFTANLRNYHSPAAAGMFKDWVRDLAGASDVDLGTLSKGNQLWNAFLQNTAAAEIGFNIGTVLKHGTTAAFNSLMQVGPGIAKAFVRAGAESPEKGLSWAGYAMKHSDELARRSRLTPEALAPQVGLKFPGADNTTWGKAKELAASIRNYGTMGVSMIDLGSAVPTWIAEYQKWNGRVSELEAVDRADRAVREAHGSSALTNKPEIMRSKNPFAQATTQFYGFFNEMLVKNYEMVWRAKNAWGNLAEGDLKAAAPDIARASNILTRMVMAGLIEEVVTGGGDPKEGWMTKTLKGTVHAFGGTLPVVRDLIHSIMSGHDPQGSLMAAGIKSYSDIARDLEGKKAWTKPWAAKFTRDMAMMGSTVSGVPLAHPVKAGQFLYNYFHHQEHPKGVMDFARGLARGTVPKERH